MNKNRVFHQKKDIIKDVVTEKKEHIPFTDRVKTATRIFPAYVIKFCMELVTIRFLCGFALSDGKMFENSSRLLPDGAIFYVWGAVFLLQMIFSFTGGLFSLKKGQKKKRSWVSIIASSSCTALVIVMMLIKWHEEMAVTLPTLICFLLAFIISFFTMNAFPFDKVTNAFERLKKRKKFRLIKST